MKERLTKRDIYWEGEGFWQSSQKPSFGEIREIYRRLAELEDKIENGTLLELPCRVGDIFYTIDRALITNEYVVCMNMVKEICTNGKVCCIINSFGSSYLLGEIYFDQIEAEEKAKELNK